MKLRALRRHINILVILGFILSGISPACKWVSGQTDLIEICTAQGLKQIAVPSGETPDGNQKTKYSDATDCLFCFAAHNTPAIYNTPALRYGAQKPNPPLKPHNDFHHFVSILNEAHQARAPPQLS